MLKNILLATLIATSTITSSFAVMININKADAETIAENLVGISKAKAIVEYRQENGKFESVEELTNVKGIGEKTLDKNRADIAVSEVTKSTSEAEKK